MHQKMSDFMAALHRFYKETPALYENDTTPLGLAVISADDSDQNMLAFRRIAKSGEELIVLCNFCPVLRTHYRIGVPDTDVLIPVFSTDEEDFGGVGTPLSQVIAEDVPMHGYTHSAAFTVPPMSVTFYTLGKISHERR